MKLTPSLSLAAATFSLGIVASPASAALISFPLTFNFVGGDSAASSGTGSFIIDDSNLAPNVGLGVAGSIDPLDGLEGFSATFTDLAAIPTTTHLCPLRFTGMGFYNRCQRQHYRC